jgi:hypothetical protein
MADPKAEQAIRKAFEELLAEWKPCTSVTIPNRAREILEERGPERVLAEIDDMETRGLIKAPLPPSRTWRLL